MYWGLDTPHFKTGSPYKLSLTAVSYQPAGIKLKLDLTQMIFLKIKSLKVEIEVFILNVKFPKQYIFWKDCLSAYNAYKTVRIIL